MIPLTWVSSLRDSRAFQLAERARDGAWFLRALRRGTFAQHGEDRFLLTYFSGYRGVYVDVGASHPFKISNTYSLYRRGWHGVTVEPIRRLYLEHRRLRPRDTQLNAGVSEHPGTLRFHELVPSVLSTFEADAAERAVRTGGAVLRRVHDIPLVTLEDIRARHFPDRRIDILSIDVEGGELSVLRGWDWNRSPPKLVVCETVQPNGGADSSVALTAFLTSHGYELLTELACNAIYRHQTSRT